MKRAASMLEATTCRAGMQAGMSRLQGMGNDKRDDYLAGDHLGILEKAEPIRDFKTSGRVIKR